VAATPLSVQTSTETGTTLAAAVNGDSSNGNNWVNSGTQLLLLTNTAGSSATCTVAFGFQVRSQTIPPITINVAANARVLAGPYPTSIYGNTVVITPSASTLKPEVLQAGAAG
jgi:hypothetical protein